MRSKNVFGATRALPRMSWSPRNLFNLWQRSLGAKVTESQFERTALSLFSQRWISKRLVRAYHGDHINEKIFKRWYLPSTLPDVRSRQIKNSDSQIAAAKWGRREDTARRLERQQEELAKAALAPVGSLMFTEVERRIDVFIFRCCFAHSVYEARRLVTHGNVQLNGKIHRNANTRLAPGDMVSVNPEAIRFLQRPDAGKLTLVTEETIEESTSDETTEADVAAPQESEDQAEKNVDDELKENDEDLSSVAAEDGAQQEEDEAEGVSPAASEPRGVVMSELERIGQYQPWVKRLELTPFTLPEYAAPFIFIPAYIEPSFTTCSAVYVRHPTARPGYSEIPTPYDADGEVVRLAWEWYAKRRPRMRSRSQLAGMPENRRNSDD